jgi:hypothetical protein
MNKEENMFEETKEELGSVLRGTKAAKMEFIET